MAGAGRLTLTALGRQQAARAGETLRRLVDRSDVAVFSSPLGRAHTTAKRIAAAIGLDAAIVLDPRLMEIGMGSWDGLTDFEIEKEWPDARNGLDRHEWFFRSPDGETYDAMESRLALALREIADHEVTDRIIVSHGIAGRIIRGLYASLARHDALRLDVPRDVIFRLHDGEVEQIDYVAEAT